jgi:hypothetical protein
MSLIACTVETVSGHGIQSIKIIKPKLTNEINKVKNLIDYLIHCDGLEYITVTPPHDIHKEALKIKALYPCVEVEVISNRIKMSM